MIMNTKQYVALFYLLLFSITASQAQSIQQSLDKGFQSFLAQPNLKNGMASLHVIDKNTGNIVFEKNSNIGLPTASTLRSNESMATILGIEAPSTLRMPISLVRANAFNITRPNNPRQLMNRVITIAALTNVWVFFSFS